MGILVRILSNQSIVRKKIILPQSSLPISNIKWIISFLFLTLTILILEENKYTINTTPYLPLKYTNIKNKHQKQKK